MSRRSFLGHRLVFCAVVLLALSGLACARSRPAVEGTLEWGRLCELWNTMIDHSSGTIYSLERFQRLSSSMDRADDDLTTLINERRISSEDGEALRRLFHARYDYILDYFYLTKSQLDRTAFEAAQQTSQWVLELDLAFLRAQYRASKPNPKLLRGSEDSLASELTFQQQCAALSTKIAQRRKQLTEQEQGKQKVDWKAFNVDRQRQEDALVAAYQSHRFRADRAVRRLLPYLLSLTHPCPPASTEDRPSL